MLFAAVVCAASLRNPRLVLAQESDQAVAEQVLGPQWKQLSRRAGMIFAGSVLSAAAPGGPIQTASESGFKFNDRPRQGATPTVELIFRVDRAIAGVETGQEITIHEWTGAWAMHRPIHSGQHILIFLYKPSRLGLSSPVGGSRGLIDLDTHTKGGSENDPQSGRTTGPRDGLFSRSLGRKSGPDATLDRLGRAIRGAREE
jgi:hypothetical protein